MNNRMVFHIIGRILLVLAAVMALPIGAAIIYGESLVPFFVPLAVCLALGLPLSLNKPKKQQMLPRDGFVTVGLSWIIISLIGTLPYMLSGALPNFFDAFFESVSGFTTTGASVIADVEAQPKSLLLWRCFTNWLGGMGVLVFLLAVMPKSDNKNSRFMHLMRAEVPGPTVEKLVARISDTARVLYGIYILLTALLVVLLLFGKMDLFEALSHAFSTAGTGGFGVKNDSVASYSPYCQYVIAVFMIIFGTNLSLFYMLVTGHVLKVLKNEELRWFLIIIAVATAGVSVTIFTSVSSAEKTFRDSLFQVSSIITTTGFSTADFEVWPNFTHIIMLLLMFCGGCVGSTAGGMKVSRLLLLAKNGRREVRYIQHPRSVISVKIDGKAADHETIRGTTSYIIMFAALFVVSVVAIMAIEGCDILTGLSSVATSLNNVGPGLSEVGPTDNFGVFTDLSKLILCFNMLAGRLELFPILMLFSPSTWRKFS